jgi:hypothetical protein
MISDQKKYHILLVDDEESMRECIESPESGLKQFNRDEQDIQD